MPQKSLDPIRVFLVEDHQGALEAISALFERTPQGDLMYVGGSTRNTPDLPQCVNASGAQVVLTDLVLSPSMLPADARKHPEVWGVAAIEALRRHGDRALKIVAYSNWSDLRQEALLAGADAFLLKTATADDLRQMLRHVMQKADMPPIDAMDLGRLTRLELFPSERAFVLCGDHCTDSILLDAAPFALLHYLALERQQGAAHWVERLEEPEAQRARYRMTQPDIWHGIAARYGVSVHLQAATIETSNLAQWATKINRGLRRWHTDRAPSTLIRVPGARKARGVPAYYTLHLGIPRQGIVIHD